MTIAAAPVEPPRSALAAGAGEEPCSELEKSENEEDEEAPRMVSLHESPPLLRSAC